MKNSSLIHEKAIERAVFFKKETRVREVEEMFEEL